MTFAEEDDIRRIAQLAADVLRSDGWTRDDFIDLATGCVCATGAIRIAAGYDPDSSAADANGYAAEVTARALRLLGSEHTGRAHLEIWNDDESRTADEVIALFERIAAGEGNS